MNNVAIVRQLNIIDGYVFNPDNRAYSLATDILSIVPGFSRKQLTTRSGQFFLETSMVGGETQCCKNVPADDIMRDFVSYIPS